MAFSLVPYMRHVESGRLRRALSMTLETTPVVPIGDGFSFTEV